MVKVMPVIAEKGERVRHQFGDSRIVPDNRGPEARTAPCTTAPKVKRVRNRIFCPQAKKSMQDKRDPSSERSLYRAGPGRPSALRALRSKAGFGSMGSPWRGI